MADSGQPHSGKRLFWRGFVADPKHGPLPLLLLVLTFLTGIVDSVSILALGRVFVANMTGNVVFVGFAVAGAPGFSLAASLFALAGFLIGAWAGGVAIHRFGDKRAVLLRNAVVLELVLIAGACALSTVATAPFRPDIKDTIAAMTAIAMGIQNSVARRLAVPDLTTTVLTMTLTGLAADMRSGDNVAVFRRLLAVRAMLAGAMAGALLVLRVSPSSALGLAVALLAAVAIAVLVAGRDHPSWT
jgi:uncharacterized membrane protein YoaK (UPF0700 family)